MSDNPVWILSKVTFSHAAAANYVIIRVLGLHDLNLFFFITDMVWKLIFGQQELSLIFFFVDFHHSEGLLLFHKSFKWFCFSSKFLFWWFFSITCKFILYFLQSIKLRIIHVYTWNFPLSVLLESNWLSGILSRQLD